MPSPVTVWDAFDELILDKVDKLPGHRHTRVRCREDGLIISKVSLCGIRFRVQDGVRFRYLTSNLISEPDARHGRIPVELVEFAIVAIVNPSDICARLNSLFIVEADINV